MLTKHVGEPVLRLVLLPVHVDEHVLVAEPRLAPHEPHHRHAEQHVLHPHAVGQEHVNCKTKQTFLRELAEAELKPPENFFMDFIFQNKLNSYEKLQKT